MPVHFDEREEETELRQTGLRRPGENLTNGHREAKVTPPLLDSTHLSRDRSLSVIAVRTIWAPPARTPSSTALSSSVIWLVARVVEWK